MTLSGHLCRVMVYETLKYGTEALQPMKIMDGSNMKSYL